VLATNNFSTVMTHYGLLPNLGVAHTYDEAQMRTYIDNFLDPLNIVEAPDDGYNKDELVELGTIAQIASQIGHTAAKNKALNALESRLTNWFTSPVTEDWAIFVYSNDFNFLAHYPNGFTSSGEFIDQHFHIAYMIYGAAILARYRPAWAAQYGAMVETVIRQINDYRKDMSPPPGNIGWFPYLRFFDPYAGHSWADPAATNQESVSEALTFAYGTFLWGETTGNTNIRDLGALLYITESEAAKLYWFDVDEDINYNWQGGTYPQHHVTILRDRGGSYATFFSADNRWKHSIVILPETAGTLWMVWDSVRVRTMYNHLPGGGYPAWDEHGYHYNYLHAGFDGEAAKNAFATYAVTEQWINPVFSHVNGDIPQLYQWVHTFDSVGVYDNTVQADITGFSVFRKDTCKHYMVYMPRGKGPRTVNFTDGQTFNVPDDTVIVYKVCESQLPVSLTSFVGKNRGQFIQLNWITSSEYNSFEFIVERSRDGLAWEALGHIPSAGNSSEFRGYEWKDYNPYDGINYYRLKQMDLDGAFVYTQSISVLFGNSNSHFLSVYPNPVKDVLTLTIPSVEVQEITFKDMLGKSYSIELSTGSTEIQRIFDVSKLSPGMYIVEVREMSGLINQIRFVKL
ncbi:MAG TPA: glycosyl hydrolase, partial [Cytophagaceae bacterium]